MAASINDKLKKYKSLFSTTLSTGIGTGTSDTITPATVTGLPTDTAITLTIDRVDSAGTATPSKLERIKGIISGGNLIDYVRGVDGTTEQAHSAGAVVEMVWNADDWNNAVDHLLVEHGQDGKHTKVNGNTVTAGTDTVALLTASQTLTNKTLTSPTINNGTFTGGGALLSKVLYFSKDLSTTGDVAYTGIGFKPTSIIAFASVDATFSSSWAMADSSKGARNHAQYDTNTFTKNAKIVHLYKDVNNHTYATIKSYDDDGFTLTWAKDGSPTGTGHITFLCLR